MTWALVTGANRGLGYEVVRQLALAGMSVVLTARDARRGHDATQSLIAQGLAVRFHALDVCVDESAATLADWVRGEIGAVGILVNNAGVYLDDPRVHRSDRIPDSPSDFSRTLDVNVVGPYRVFRALRPYLARNARVINVSSGMGRFVECAGNSPFYRSSKAALNMLTASVAAASAVEPIEFFAVCPGWTRTDMGGAGAVRSVEEGAKSIVDVALHADSSQSGFLLRNGERFGW